ncbi:MAG: hypothetical protein PWR17_823 [Candidatus Methanomethylophilaceae archaeon]|nr:hypothetical protein [Candidatus Methanomethylophilaceae archaeon]
MSVDEIIESLKRHRGVRKVALLEEDLVDIIKEEESQIVSVSGMPIVNEAMEVCLSKDIKLCIYCDYSFEHPDDSTMFMKDGEGRIVGQDIADSKRSQFEGKDGIIWLSDDFILYPGADMGPDIRIVMVPQVYHGFSEEDGVSEAVVFSPATTTDCIIKSRYGDPQDPQIASAIMGLTLN